MRHWASCGRAIIPSRSNTFGGNTMACKFLLAATIAGAVLAFSSSGFAEGQFGTAAEARALLEKAVSALKADETAALTKFNSADGGFRDRDLYVFCFDLKTGIRKAHSIVESIGKDLRLQKEKDGSPLGQKIFDAANSVKDGETTIVNYNFPRPGGTDPMAKQSFVTRVGSLGCGVGYYK
jgi:cytochrome c